MKRWEWITFALPAVFLQLISVQMKFAISPRLYCFTDLTLNDPYQWLWNFGDDDSAIIKNPIHQFVSEGLYHISLTATNVLGSNSLTKENFIQVYASDSDFHDDFEDGEILDLWQQIRGTWSEHDGAFIPDFKRLYVQSVSNGMLSISRVRFMAEL